MLFGEKQRRALQAVLDDPADPHVSAELFSLYWNSIGDHVGEILRSGGDVAAFLQEERDFINFGLLPEFRDDCWEVAAEFPAMEKGFVEIELFTDWIARTIGKIRQNDKVEHLRSEIAATRSHLKRTGREVEEVRVERREAIMRALESTDTPARLVTDRFKGIDDLQVEVLKARRAIARGVYFPVKERRAFVERETALKKDAAECDAFLSGCPSDADKADVRSLGRRLLELFAARLDMEETIGRLEEEARGLQDRQSTLSPIEVEAGFRKELDYLRDIVRLSARRLRGESCPVLRAGDAVFTPAELRRCLDRIFEFDPRIFQNDRAAFLGRPSFLLVPGNGNAVYDWKNNRIVIPLVPPAGNGMASLATALIEYRIDVDEEKRMISAYGKLPHLKGLRSIFQVRARLTKDYLSWMVSEARGFRVLPRECRAWFEHAIAPGKNEIYCPQAFQPFNMTAGEYRRLLAEVESRLTDDLAESGPEELWTAHILNYQQGKFERAFDCIKAYVQKEPGNAFGFYNLGHLGLCVNRRKDAVEGFAEFCKRNARSWWATVIQEHLRRLRGG